MLKRIVFIASVLILSVQTQASSFVRDLGYFKYALQFQQLSEAEIETFLNPYYGRNQFRLSDQNAPWAGNYFPMSEGGLATRWQDPASTIKNREHLLSKEEVLLMNANQIAKLSPIEKIDLLRGDYQFTKTLTELNARGPLRLLPPQDWEGFCNGVRCAGLILKEPRNPVTVKNQDGVEIKFLPADLKALGGASYFYVEKYAQLGAPTRAGKAEDQPNAAIFDLVLRYQLAAQGKGFVADTHLRDEIWNESVVGYRRVVSEPLPIKETDRERFFWLHKKILVDVILETLGEVDIHKSNSKTTDRVANGSLVQEMKLQYLLYLDNTGQVRDGEWINPNDSRGIDFIWFGGGKGTDANLDHHTIEVLFNKAAHLTCKQIYL